MKEIAPIKAIDDRTRIVYQIHRKFNYIVLMFFLLFNLFTTLCYIKFSPLIKSFIYLSKTKQSFGHSRAKCNESQCLAVLESVPRFRLGIAIGPTFAFTLLTPWGKNTIFQNSEIKKISSESEAVDILMHASVASRRKCFTEIS